MPEKPIDTFRTGGVISGITTAGGIDRRPSRFEQSAEQKQRADNLDFLDDGAVDFAFASNLFEHLTKEEFATALDALRRKLSKHGTLTIIQPNYRYVFRQYFDDFDHKSVYTHVSLPDYLVANGYEVFLVEPRFMPLSVKGRLPVKPFLIRAWLALPIKPIGKQMLVRARPRC
jgi:hypothetical protein